MSGAQTPTFSEAQRNVLFNPLAVPQAQELQNKLAGQQIDISNANVEQVSRASAGLLSAYPDEASRAAAYPRVVGMLQSQGFAKQAPATYPGEAVLRSLVNQSIPASDQYKMGILNPPGLTEALARAGAPPPGYGGTGTGTTGTTATPGTAAAPSTIEPTALTSATAVRDGLIKRGMDPVTATAFAANKLHESGGTLDSGPGDGGASQGNFMWNGDRNTEYQQLYGHTPQGAPLDEQLDFVMHELNGKESNARDAINAAEGVDGKAAAISRYYLRPKDVVGEVQRRSATALQLQRQLASTAQPGAPGGATAPGVAMGDATRPDLAPPPPGGTAGIPAPYQATGGGIGSVLGGTARVARPTNPAGAPVITDQPAGSAVVAGPPGAAVVGQPAPPSAAVPGNVNAINAGIARAGGAPAQAVTPEPGWGTAIGTYGPQSTPAAPPPAPAATVAQAQPASAPAATAQPGAAPLPGTGINSQQFQTALWKTQQAALLETQFPNSPAAKAKAAELRAEAALYMQADSVITLPNGIQVKALSGERLNAAAPNANYVWNEKQGAYVDTTGVHPPVTPPSPRLTATPGGAILQSKPGGGATVVYQTPPADITTQESAKTAGAAAGTATGKLTSQLATQGITAGRAINTIDEGMDQLRRAKASGINTGALAPWLSTYAAVAKSLGVLPLESIGIQPDAVGNIQTAKKTLALVSGQILQQILGPESQVTEGKINQFISATPGIETDPAALERVLNWARAQFVYEREMAAKGMEDASVNNGVLPNNWQAKYYHEHGFAPLYDPTGAGEMKQPDGQAPSREAPKAAGGVPTVSSDADYHALPSGTVFLDPNGKRRTKP